jgi:hypothetical protein
MSPLQASARLNDKQWLASLSPDIPLTPETIGRASSWLKEHARDKIFPGPFVIILERLIGPAGQENKYSPQQVERIRALFFTLHTDGYCDADLAGDDNDRFSRKAWINGISFAFWAPPREIVQAIKACPLEPDILKAWVNTSIVENGLTLILGAAHPFGSSVAAEDAIRDLVAMGADASVQMPAERSYDPGANILHFVSQPRTIHTLMAASNPPDINAQDDKGRTPIMCPVMNDTWLRLAALLSHSPDLSLQDAEGKTASEFHTPRNGQITDLVRVIAIAETLPGDDLPELGRTIRSLLHDAARPLAKQYFQEHEPDRRASHERTPFGSLESVLKNLRATSWRLALHTVQNDPTVTHGLAEQVATRYPGSCRTSDAPIGDPISAPIPN